MNDWVSVLAAVAAGLATGGAVGVGIVWFVVRRVFHVIDNLPALSWYGGVDLRLKGLEGRVGVIDTDVAKVNLGLEHLSEVLEHYFKEIQEDVRAAREQAKADFGQYREDDDKAHRDIKDLIAAFASSREK